MALYRFLGFTAGDYMSKSAKALTRDMMLREAEALFERHDFNSFPVVDGGGKVVGIISKFDFLKAFAFTTQQMVPNYEELMSRTIGNVMTESVITVEPSAPLTRVLQLMISMRARSFPVVSSEGSLLGMISRTDIMRALKEAVKADA